LRKHIRKNRYKNPQSDQPPKSFFMRVADLVFRSLCSVAFIGGMSLLFIFGHDMLTQCDYFKAQNIIIRGDSSLKTEQIMDVARIKRGTNILSVNLSAVQKRLLAIPWIAQADVYREFPGTVIILIKEHKPLGVLDLGRPFLFDQKGDIFKEATAEEAQGIPVVTGIDCADWKTPGMPVSKVFNSVMQILKMGKSDGEVISNKMIKTIQVDREIGLTLNIEGPIETIKLGYDDYRAKYDRLTKIFSYLKNNNGIPAIAAIDLKILDHIDACLSNDKPPEGKKKEVSGGKA
jgi:cell division protein FtsQ